MTDKVLYAETSILLEQCKANIEFLKKLQDSHYLHGVPAFVKALLDHRIKNTERAITTVTLK